AERKTVQQNDSVLRVGGRAVVTHPQLHAVTGDDRSLGVPSTAVPQRNRTTGTRTRHGGQENGTFRSQVWLNEHCCLLVDVDVDELRHRVAIEATDWQRS